MYHTFSIEERSGLSTPVAAANLGRPNISLDMEQGLVMLVTDFEPTTSHSSDWDTFSQLLMVILNTYRNQ
jgi:hypothetical protein